MAVRRKDHHAEQAFGEWRERHIKELRRIGLFPSVYLDWECWMEFIENGHLELHPDPSRFVFDQLNEQQQRALLRFLFREYGQQETPPRLMDWLRARYPDEIKD